jgi:hypothetical protein
MVSVVAMAERTALFFPPPDLRYKKNIIWIFWQLSMQIAYRDGILEYQFDKRPESFALCYSQSRLLRADFKDNHTLLLF